MDLHRELPMSQTPIADLVDVATQAAFRAGRRTLADFNTGVAVERKGDGSPVTRADRDAEALLWESIEAAFPDHGILGEERGEKEGKAPYRWIVDPIDGTETFIRGVPFYGVLVGVESEGEPVAGVIYHPALDLMVAAGKGLGCTLNGRPARASETSHLADAALMVTDDRACRRQSRGYSVLADEVNLVRTWADCYGYALLASGRVDIMVDAVVKPWDLCAIVPIVEESGGRFSSWAGERTIFGGNAVATNGHLHDVVKTHLQRPDGE
jgi:histidinol phosphatase-like enzyme (inositol monophosphatase family)